MRYHVTGVINDKHGALVTAGVLQAVQKRIKRDDRGQHTGKISVNVLEWHSHDECRTIVRRESQRIAAEFSGLLHAPYEGALQRFSDEGILIGAIISL